MNIGILGGSFNPAHQGHYFISSVILKKLALKQIWWVVTPTNPHKEGQEFISLDKRLQIASQINKNYNIKVKCLEKAGWINYSYLLIEKLIKQYPQHKFFWIIGEDNLAKFHHWHRWDFIAQKINIIVFPRNNNLLQSTHSRFAIRYKKFFISYINDITYKPTPYWTIIRNKQKHISASHIRNT